MLAKVCSRSQGQPFCGSRSRAMSVMSASIAARASPMRASAAHGCCALEGQRTDTQAIERQQHAGGRTPDGAPFEGDVPELDLGAAADEAAALHAEVARVEDVIEWHLEDPLHFFNIRERCEPGAHESHHR